MRSARTRFIAVQVALVAAVVGGLWLSYPGWRLGLITDHLRDEYRDLQFITTTDLGNWLSRESTTHPFIADARTPEEFVVSHLVEAYRVSPDGELNPDDLPDDRKRAIVAYCSTGERAAALGRRLQRAGYGRIFVLEGGIVRWANEERPLSNGRELVTRVHPGDSKTALLLKGAHRAPLPAAP